MSELRPHGCHTDDHERHADRIHADIKDSILDAIGDTPLVRLSRIGAGPDAAARRQGRVAQPRRLDQGPRRPCAMIEAAERDGRCARAARSSSRRRGNTGTGLAIAARLKGYRVIAVMPDKMSQEKIDLLRAYGAEVVIAPTAVAARLARVLLPVADRLTEEIPGAFQPNQYCNPANPEAHYASTGPELWDQTGGRITHSSPGVGTGGTITGTGRYLKERNPDRGHRRRPRRLDLLRADEVKPYLVEGVGEDFWPRDLRPVDRRPLRDRLRPRLLPDDAPPGDGGGDPRRRLVRHWPSRRARGRARDRPTPRRWSP